MIKLAVLSLIERIYAALGMKPIDVRYLQTIDAQRAEEEAISAISERIRQAQVADEGPIPPGLLKILDLPPDATVDDAVMAIEELKKRRALIKEIQEERITEMVDQAINPGPGDIQGKLYPDEREWALKFGRENPEAFETFLKKRSKAFPLLNKFSFGKRSEAGISDAEEMIMRQVGVSRELFLKYNPAVKPSGIDEAQERMNRQCGVSDELFRKYNG